MFCKYCGKYTDNESAVCDECAASMATSSEGGTHLTKMYGFKNGLVSAICGGIGTIFSAVAVLYGALAFVFAFGEQIEDFEGIGDVSYFIPVTIVMSVLAVALAIVGVVFGARAIRDFKQAKTHGTKPVATLILGIAGVACGAATMVLVLMAILFILMVPVVKAA